MKKFVLKTLNIIRWIIVGCSILVAALSLSVMFELMTEEGGAPGYDPEAIFIFYMIVAAVSLLITFTLAFLERLIILARLERLIRRFKNIP